MDDIGGEIQLEEDEKVQEQEEKARLITQVIFLWWISWLPYCSVSFELCLKDLKSDILKLSIKPKLTVQVNLSHWHTLWCFVMIN